MNQTIEKQKSVDNFDANSFFDGIKHLIEIYEKVNLAIKYSEMFDPENKMNIAPMNQLRNAVGHIFTAAAKSDQSETLSNELKEVKEHLERAGYDALSILAVSFLTSITNLLANYPTDMIATKFPKYYSEYKPELSDIKITIAQIRTENNVDIEKPFEEFFDQIEKLREIEKQINEMIPVLQKYKNENGK